MASRWRDPTWTDGQSAEHVVEQQIQADRIDALASKIFAGREDLNAEPKAEIVALVKSVSESLDSTFAGALYRYARDVHFVRDEDLSHIGLRNAFRR